MAYSEGYEYHIHLKQGDIGRYVFLPGDPGRCEVIAQHFDNPRFVASHREHTTWVGELDGVPVAVTSTGMGGPSAAIAVEELIHVGADTFMRVGTSGAMQPETQPGDIAVINASIRDEGTGLHYLPMEYPAVADQDIINGLVLAAAEMGRRYHVGVSQSKDSFYGQHDPTRCRSARASGSGGTPG
ncbi:nucleoside phosphorylase [Tessaracoccus coleopterorum]|uniref:nucleoside phosphorylase n=1 Tax=Tessaracoccus coleopterorum TaxID=2714950 RepID=UPI0018D2F95A|nr:nucleoside phosphorylase [Tessaracoccus coleopterorum]